MDKKQDQIWNWIYALIFPVSFIVIITGLVIWVTGAMSRDNLFLLMLAPTVLIVSLTVLHLANLTLKKLKAKRLFETRISTALLLVFMSFIFISWTNYLKPAAKLDCTFDLTSLVADIKLKFRADSVHIETTIFEEEIYFPRIICPVITISNPTAGSSYFTASDKSKKQFQNLEEIESELKKECQFIADRISSSCNIDDYNDLIIEFTNGKNGEKFVVHYNQNVR